MRETDSLPLSYRLPGLVNLSANLHSLLNSRTQHFSAIEPWLDFSRTCDISLGMRIHGNMIPLQAGVPSIVVTHDSRTSGLSKTMGIPTISAKEFAKLRIDKVNQTLLEKIIIDLGNYDQMRGDILINFRDFFSNNNIKADHLEHYLA